MIHALNGPACRFEPSCSEYARDAIAEQGMIRGGAWRCGEWRDAILWAGMGLIRCERIRGPRRSDDHLSWGK